MIFSSFTFLFLFLPIVLIVNKFLYLKWSNLFLLATSLGFCFFGEVGLTFLLVASIFWNYSFGVLLFKYQDYSKAKKIICLFPVLSRIIPEGIENNPYAMKKDSGRKEARTKLKSKD